ncbi:MAG: transketolase [Acidimicrobiia bacterium]|nr:transketolase [Acidimicrobiia bacterium]
MPSPLPPDVDEQAISLIRGFAMDAPLAAKSGHQGTAMALAPLGHVLFSRVMKYDPTDPEWPDRDRFVLSNGHASILQYSLLYLAGMGLELDDIKAFRSWESATPGHPEARHTAGVEVTTGPLGQGFGDAVGMAIAERVLRARFGPQVVDHHTFVIAGDGCFMEGISHEAASLAGHIGLGRLICVYDDNRITIDGPTALSYTDDVGARFAAYGWHVEYLGETADDCDALEAALQAAKADEAQPTLLVLRSHVGYPSPDHTDDHLAHGNPFTAEDVARTKAVMGIPDEPFWSPPEVVTAYREATAERAKPVRATWDEALAALDAEERAAWDAAWQATGIAGWEDALPTFEQGESIATRQAIAKVVGACLPLFPGLVSGAADLTGNTGTKLPDGTEAQTAEHPGGRQLYYGIREHAMGAALVGMACHGGILPLGGTFFVFLDYMRPPVRLAAVSQAKAVFVFSHDSVGVGEDGPTHQPVEHLATLRAIPGLQVIRPADANETVAAWRAAVASDGPTVLVLTRQNVTVCTDGSAVARGAGIVRAADGDTDLVIVATGSEVALAITAAERLESAGTPTRVVSLPSWDRFAAAGEDYRRQLFPDGVPVLSVEAATTFGWERYADDSIGIDRFGASAPGDVVLEKLGINLDHVVERATALVTRSAPTSEGSS